MNTRSIKTKRTGKPNNLIKSDGLSDKLEIITVNTSNSVGLINFLETANKYRYNVTVLAQGNKYSEASWKPNIYLEYLKNSNSDLCCLIDSTNSYFGASPDSLKNAYLTYNSDIVVSCDPDIDISDQNTLTFFTDLATKRGTRVLYPNAGLIIGKRIQLIDLMIETLDCLDGQDGLAKKLAYGCVNYTLDYNSLIVSTIKSNDTSYSKLHTPVMFFPDKTPYKYNQYLIRLHPSLPMKKVEAEKQHFTKELYQRMILTLPLTLTYIPIAILMTMMLYAGYAPTIYVS